MPNLKIMREFTYQHVDGYKEVIPAGDYDLPDDLYNSPYVRGFSDDPLPAKYQPGMPQHAALMAQYEASQRLASSQENQVADDASQNARSEFRKADRPAQARRPNQRARVGENVERAQINDEALRAHEDPTAPPSDQGEAQSSTAAPSAAPNEGEAAPPPQ